MDLHWICIKLLTFPGNQSNIYQTKRSPGVLEWVCFDFKCHTACRWLYSSCNPTCTWASHSKAALLSGLVAPWIGWQTGIEGLGKRLALSPLVFRSQRNHKGQGGGSQRINNPSSDRPRKSFHVFLLAFSTENSEKCRLTPCVVYLSFCHQLHCICLCRQCTPYWLCTVTLCFPITWVWQHTGHEQQCSTFPVLIQ